MIRSHADPALITGHIVNSVWNRLAQFLIREVMHPYLLRGAFGLPFTASVLEVAHQLFLLGIDGNYRRPSLLKGLCLLADVLKLRVPVWMRCSVLSLAVGLSAGVLP